MAKSTISVTFSFADDTTRSVEFGPFATNSAAITNVKTNLKNFGTADIAELYLSDGGANCTGVASASVTTLNETEINLND